MKNKVLRSLVCIVLSIIAGIGLTSYSSKEKKYDENLEATEVVNSLVDLALEETNDLLGEYIDIDYFTNLKYSTEVLVDSMQKLSLRVSNDNEYIETVDKEQYDTLTVSISNIFDDLNTEEYNVFKELAKDDEDIAEFLDMVDNGFEEYDSDSELSQRTATANVAKLSDGIMAIGGILASQKVCNAAIIAIKGAFKSMVATLKAFFVPNVVKGIIITAAILIIATVVIVNWNKIKPVFDRIVGVFVDNAKKLASTVAKVFNTIFKSAQEAEKTESGNQTNEGKDVADDATSQNQMQKQVEKGQAPNEVDRVDKAHDKNGQDHVHFKDGTSINKDGTIHDKGHGTPNLTKKVLEWLNRNGWCLNGLKN